MNRRQKAAEARRGLDQRLTPYRSMTHQRPPRGWIRAIRNALGMTSEQLGRRMSISQPTAQRMELSEENDTIQLGTLRRAAEALDCELVYVLLPRQELQARYQAQARDVALKELARVRHTMALEDQAVDDRDDAERLQAFIEQELDPREVWASRA